MNKELYYIDFLYIVVKNLVEYPEEQCNLDEITSYALKSEVY